MIALGAPFGYVEHATVLFSQLDADPAGVGGRVGPEVESRDVRRTPSTPHQFHLLMWGRLVVQSAECAFGLGQGDACLGDLGGQALVGKLTAAPRPREKAPLVAQLVDVDHVNAFDLGGGEDHRGTSLWPIGAVAE